MCLKSCALELFWCRIQKSHPLFLSNNVWVPKTEIETFHPTLEFFFLHKVQSLPGEKIFKKYFLVIKPRNIVNFTTSDVLMTHKVQKWQNTSMLWPTGLQNSWKLHYFTRQNLQYTKNIFSICVQFRVVKSLNL